MSQTQFSDPQRGEVSEERAADLDALAEEAEQRYAGRSEQRLGFRWETGPLAVVKRAADLAGVPFQTYVKQAAFRQAITDLKDAAAAGVAH